MPDMWNQVEAESVLQDELGVKSEVVKRRMPQSFPKPQPVVNFSSWSYLFESYLECKKNNNNNVMLNLFPKFRKVMRNEGVSRFLDCVNSIAATRQRLRQCI